MGNRWEEVTDIFESAKAMLGNVGRIFDLDG